MMTWAKISVGWWKSKSKRQSKMPDDDKSSFLKKIFRLEALGCFWSVKYDIHLFLKLSRLMMLDRLRYDYLWRKNVLLYFGQGLLTTARASYSIRELMKPTMKTGAKGSSSKYSINQAVSKSEIFWSSADNIAQKYFELMAVITLCFLTTWAGQLKICSIWVIFGLIYVF